MYISSILKQFENIGSFQNFLKEITHKKEGSPMKDRWAHQLQERVGCLGCVSDGLRKH